ncbi:Choline kinase [Actinopolyspora mzabensis]|uniref:Choline kinase n=1 Tax=Actinopolyspora mzabensis TaxID=995066 RepID=A0A1G9A179_ACTMZ|nr:phosphocholine cytidylyltransferase family protein [Actinopolyspora mzabensis]SDK21139.1 Choline kinase [Actinopolyspora mzabensis]
MNRDAVDASNSVRVIVLSAGLGTRLRPHTDYVPKALVPVDGEPIIERLLARLALPVVHEVVCVTGYHAELLEKKVSAVSERPPVRFVYNVDYASANNILSLTAVRDLLTGPTVIIDGDLILSTDLVERILYSVDDTLAVDVGTDRSMIDMAVEIRGGRVWHLQKQLPPERISGEVVGVSYWTGEGIHALLRAADDVIDREGTEGWYMHAVRAVAKQRRLEPLWVKQDDWMEIDTVADLERAEREIKDCPPWAR